MKGCYSALLLAMVVSVGFAAEQGQTAVWLNKGARGSLLTSDFFTDANWQGGEAPEFTDATATNVLVDLTATPSESGRLAEIAAGETGKYFGPITLRHEFDDSSNTAFYLQGLRGGVWTTISPSWSSKLYPFVLRDGASYDGVFDVKDDMRNAYVQYYLYPEPGATSTLNRVVIKGGPGVKVPTGSYGIVRDLIGPGSLGVNETSESSGHPKLVLPKETAGTVEILCTPGPLTSLRVADGQVVLHGHVAPLTRPAGEPALRLDASCVESLTTTGAAACVTQWRDADGRAAPVANAPTDGVHLPRLVTDPTTGLKKVDFGGLLNSQQPFASEEIWGPAGYLRLNSKIANAREIHVVFRDHFTGSPMPTLVGNGLSEWASDWLRQDRNCLFSTSSPCDAPVSYGSVLFNGQRTAAASQPDTRRTLNVVASSLSDGHLGNVLYIGAAEPGVMAWQGGAEIAELIVYTNVLTEAERQATHRYLMAKWRPETKVWDYERVMLKKNAELDVPDGVLSVRELSLPENATTFTKRGAGTLELGSFPATLKEIIIEAGDVAFANSHTAVDTPQVAPDATVHLDASRWEADVEYFQDGDKKRVICWNGYPRTNRNGDSYSLRTPESFASFSITNATVRLDASPTGLPMIDCGHDYRQCAADGKTVTNDATMLTFCRNGTFETGGDARHREGFLVYMKTADESTALSCVDWTIVKMASGSNLQFLNDGYSFNRLTAGTWSFDGSWIDPANCVNSKDEVHVVAFRGTRPLAMNSFFNDRNTRPDGGGMIGEVVYYDRTLSPQERRDTELYLLRKWKDPSATHPRDALLPNALPKLTYADSRKDVSLHVDSGSTVSIPALNVESLSLSGAGTLATAVDSERLKSVQVDGGYLRLTEDVWAGAVYRADAADVSSMTYTVDANGVTNVTVWNRANWVPSFGNTALTYPKLSTEDVNGTGRRMPMMDFGVFAKYDESSLLTAAAAMNMPYWGDSWEFYIVTKTPGFGGRADGQTYRQQIIGSVQEGKDPVHAYYLFYRGPKNNTILDMVGNDDRSIYNGYIAVDGTARAYNYSLPVEERDQTHVYSFVPQNAVQNSTFAFSRRENYHFGGQRVGEFVCFSHTNSVARRTALENHLRAKWLGHDVPIVPNLWNLDEVSFSERGELMLPGCGTASVKTLTGGGSVAFDQAGGGLRDTTSLAFAFRSKDDYDAITVDGSFAVGPSGSATVAFDLVRAFRPKELAGDYVVFSAESLTTPENFANWTLSVIDAPANVTASLAYDPARGLVLHVLRNGLCVIIK